MDSRLTESESEGVEVSTSVEARTLAKAAQVGVAEIVLGDRLIADIDVGAGFQLPDGVADIDAEVHSGIRLGEDDILQ